MIRRVNESRILIKPNSCDCKCKFQGIKCNSNQNWNTNKCWFECKNPIKHNYEKCYVWNPSRFACEINRYLKKYR